MRAFTIGYTQKTPEEFFTLLNNPQITRVVDIRLSNNNPFAGFTKKNYLEYFLRAICNLDYIHRLDLAPTKAMFVAYKNSHDWAAYETSFLELLRQRNINNIFTEAMVNGSCFLCSEPTPEQCHRRLVVEYLQSRWRNLEIIHL